MKTAINLDKIGTLGACCKNPYLTIANTVFTHGESMESDFVNMFERRVNNSFKLIYNACSRL